MTSTVLVIHKICVTELLDVWQETWHFPDIHIPNSSFSRHFRQFIQ